MEWHDNFESEDEFYYFHQPSSVEEKHQQEGVKYFVHTDSEQRLEDVKNNNINDKPYETVKDWTPIYHFYKDSPIVYNFNSDGFRDSELPSKPETIDVYLGCSFTSGVGLHEKDIWVTKVSEKLNFPKLNAGVGSTGIIYQYRLLMWLLKKFKIRNLFHYYPLTHARWEWYDSTFGFDRYRSWSASDPNIEPIHQLAEFRNISLMSHTFIKAIKQICSEHSINYFLEYKYIFLNVDKYSLVERYARDVGHPGPAFHDILAEKFLKKLGKSL